MIFWTGWSHDSQKIRKTFDRTAKAAYDFRRSSSLYVCFIWICSANQERIDHENNYPPVSTFSSCHSGVCHVHCHTIKNQNQNPTLYKVQNPGNERRQIYKALASIQVDAIFHTRYTVKFRKQAPPCISRSKYKPQNSKLVTQKTLR